MSIKKKYVNFRKNINKHGLVFHYNIRADPMLGMGYVSVRRIPCSFSVCLRKLDSRWNRRQDKYNQV